MNVQLPQGEVIIKEGAANLQKGIETVGGKLRLTNQRLLFKAHKLNVCLLYTSPSPRDRTRSRMPSSA